jgi:hypothetical protein
VSTNPGNEGGTGVEAPLFTGRPLHRVGELLDQSFESTSSAATQAYDTAILPGNFPVEGEHKVAKTPPHTYIGSAAEARHHWAMLVGTAVLAWEKLTEAELLETDGDLRRLAELITDRYGIAPEVAGIQVRNFLAKHSL